MSKSNTNTPVGLLNRLKIGYSLSQQSDVNKIQRDPKQNLSNSKENSKTKSCENTFYKVPRQTLLQQSVSSQSNKVLYNKFSSSKNSVFSVKKDVSRPKTTFARYLTTPSGDHNQSFIVDICQKILSSKIKNIVIMAGAGISCPSGIPDFRTPGTGLYDNLKKYKIPYPEAIFDIDYFFSNPKPFYVLAKELFPGKYRPNKVHYFLKLLQEKKLLRRIYTQNIDGLERLAGISDNYLVEAHGTFASASCTDCREKYSAEQMKKSIDEEKIFYCSKCSGIVKPDIVFFGEGLPAKFHQHQVDFNHADLLFVMGTSLEVEPFASIVDSVRFNTPRILLNRDMVGVFRSKRRIHDNSILGDITESIDTIVKTLRWEKELDKIMKKGEEQQINFLDTIPKPKAPPINTRNFSTMANNGRSAHKILPLIQSKPTNNAKNKNNQEDSSSESLQSSSTSFDSESSSQ